ncbi:MAG: membrane protein insertase YidC [Bacteroidales bacterium]|jgi:YidC/Oxa1 family membrane protein insertase
MDKKSLIGLLLMGVLLIGYSIFTRPSKELLEKTRRFNDSIALVEAQKRIEAENLRRNDTVSQVAAVPTPGEDSLKRANELGAFADASIGEEKFFYLENKKIRLKFSTRGGRPYSVELKDYKTFDGQPVLLFDGETTHFSLQFFSRNKSITTQSLYFQPQSTETAQNAETGSKSLVMRLPAGEGAYIDYVYTLEPDTYKLGFNIRMQGMDQMLGKNTTMIDLDWGLDVRQQEKGRKWEGDYATIQYKFYQNDVGKLGMSKENKPATENLTTKIEWIGFKQQFFSTVLMANNYLTSARISSTALTGATGPIKTFSAEISLPYEGKTQEDIGLAFYFVPNHYKTLKAEGHELTILVDLGWKWISWINKWFVINIFHWLEGVIGNYGIIIIILTIFFKLLVFPLSYKSFLSGARMKVLKPQIDEINKKFGTDKAMEKQQATMALYKKAGVNPLGGCLPALLQMPIWIALFRFFPSSIELRQQSFLWAHDLSTYDSILTLPFTIPGYGAHVSLFTLLMAASMLVTTKMQMDQTQTAQPVPGMKIMMYMMPVMMLVWFNSYAAGLSVYYFFSNVISYLQQIVIKRSINEEKILNKLKENQKKPVKKSKFQERLELMAKQRGVQTKR